MQKRFGVKKQILIYVIFVSTLLLICIGAILIPATILIKKLGNDIEIAQTEVEKQHGKSQLIRRSIQEIGPARTFQETTKKITVDDGDELTIITAFEKISETHGINQQLNIEKRELENSDGLDSTKDFIRAGYKNYYNVSVSSRGELTKLLQYLNEIERLPFYVFIDLTTWQANTDNRNMSSTNLISLDFNARVLITPSSL